MAAAVNMGAALRGNMPQYLQQSSRYNLQRLQIIFREAADIKRQQEGEAHPTDPRGIAPPDIPAILSLRRSLRLTTKDTTDKWIIACLQQPVARPENPPITVTQSSVAAPQPPPRVAVPQPPPRVELTRKLPCMAAKVPPLTAPPEPQHAPPAVASPDPRVEPPRRSAHIVGARVRETLDDEEPPRNEPQQSPCL